MSIRTDIFKNHTTLLGILDEEGISENNERFSTLGKRISTLDDRTKQTQTQLIDLSTIVSKNRADFNTFELKTNNTLASLDERVLEAHSLATEADNTANTADTNANAALSVSEQLATSVVDLDKSVTTINSRIGDLNLKIQNLGLTVTSHTSQIQDNSNQIVSLQNQITNLGSPYIILQRRTKFYYLKATMGQNAYIYIDWDTPSTITTTVMANTPYWAEVSYSSGPSQRVQVKMVAEWDTFRTTGIIAYPILKGIVRCQTIAGTVINSYMGTAIVDI
ncbi:MAG: hypothetical protein FuNoV1_gp2 [Hangzhou nora-like virus 1]|nr:MAG: hypothetical protein FuNoV1_gp2 [Hangzhou nora-like virus 1]